MKTLLSPVRIAALALLGAVLASYGLVRSSPPTRDLSLDRIAIAPVQGHAYFAPLKLAPAVGYSTASDSNENATASTVVVTENGRPLGPAHSVHTDIFALGSGRFSHWGENILFSASDNSDPRSNGRAYTLRQPVTLPAWLDLAAVGVVVIILLLLRIHFFVWQALRAAARWLARAWNAMARSAVAIIRSGLTDERARRPSSKILRVLGCAFLAVIVGADAWLTLVPSHRETRLDAAAANALRGYAYQVPAPLTAAFGFSAESDSNGAPTGSTTQLLEDGRPLGPGHQQHQEIIDRGGGRYSHWSGTFIFAASDNSDPHSNGRIYSTLQLFCMPIWAQVLAGLAAIALLWVARADRWPGGVYRFALRRLARFYRPALRIAPALDSPIGLTALALTIVAALGVLQVLRPTWYSDASPAAIKPVKDHAYMVAAPAGAGVFDIPSDTNLQPERSAVVVTENGVRLGPAHAYHPDIYNIGGGRYSHWDNQVVFSTTDGSDPRSNGRTYAVSGRTSLAPWIWIPALVVAGLLALRAAFKVNGLRAVRFVMHWTGPVCLCIAMMTAGLAAYAVWQENGFYPVFSPDSSTYLNSPGQRGYIVMIVMEAGRVLGLTPQWVVSVQFAAYAAGAFMLGRAVGRVSGSMAVGWLLTALLFCDTELLRYLQYLLSEPLFFAVVMAHAAFGIDAVRTRTARDLALCASAAGLAMLVRPAGYGFLVGLVALAILIRPFSIRRISIGAAAFGAVIAAGVAPNVIQHRIFATHIFGGISLLGHVVQFADRDAPYQDPELANAVIDATADFSTAAKASYPDGYWRATVNEYNDLLWRRAAPAAQKLFGERVKDGREVPKDMSTKTDTALKNMAVTVILDHPAEYVKHVAAEVYGMWVSLFVAPGHLGLWLETDTEASRQLVAVNRELQELVGSREYPPAKVVELWKRGSRQVAAVDVVWEKVRPAFQALVWPTAALTLLLCFFALGVAVLQKGLPPFAVAACFCSIQVWSYAGLIAATQPALGRYSSVNAPLILAVFAVLIAAAAAALQRITPLAWRSWREANRRHAAAYVDPMEAAGLA